MRSHAPLPMVSENKICSHESPLCESTSQAAIGSPASWHQTSPRMGQHQACSPNSRKQGQVLRASPFPCPRLVSLLVVSMIMLCEAISYFPHLASDMEKKGEMYNSSYRNLFLMIFLLLIFLLPFLLAWGSSQTSVYPSVLWVTS